MHPDSMPKQGGWKSAQKVAEDVVKKERKRRQARAEALGISETAMFLIEGLEDRIRKLELIIEKLG